MNKGPARKKVRINPSEGDFVSPLTRLPGELSSLPATVIEIIIDYIPAYRLFGRKSIHGVNKFFNHTAKAPRFKCKKTLDALLASCVDPTDALTILSDESIINQLSFNSIISIAEYHEELVRYMLTVPQIYKELNYGMVRFGIKYPSLAPKILSMPEHHLDFRVALAAKSCDKAQEILNTPLICNTLNESHLGLLGYNHFLVAQHILNTPVLRAKAKIYSLSSNHPTLAELLLSTTEWTTKNAQGLVELGAKHLSVAKLIIETSSVCEVLSGRQLGRLCAYHCALSQYVLDTLLWQRLDGQDLEWIGIHHPIIAQQILCRPELYNLLTGSGLALLGLEDRAGAELILNTPHLCQKLLDDLMDVARIGIRDLAIAQKILASPDLRNKLDGKSLAYLGSNHPPIAEQIFKSEPLRNKLKGRDIVTIGLKKPTLIQYILDTPELCNKLTSRDIGQIALECIAFRRLILARPDLSEKICDADLKEMQFRVSFSSNISLCAQELKQATQQRNSRCSIQ